MLQHRLFKNDEWRSPDEGNKKIMFFSDEVNKIHLMHDCTAIQLYFSVEGELFL